MLKCIYAAGFIERNVHQGLSSSFSFLGKCDLGDHAKLVLFLYVIGVYGRLSFHMLY